MVEVAAGMGVGGDVHVVELQFSIADQAEPVAKVGLSGPDRFHLGAHQFDAGFQGFKDVVLMPGQAVIRQQTIGCGSCGSGTLLASSFGHPPSDFSAA